MDKLIAAYHSDKNQYPKSSVEWDAVVALFGESKKDWIPALASGFACAWIFWFLKSLCIWKIATE